MAAGTPTPSLPVSDRTGCASDAGGAPASDADHAPDAATFVASVTEQVEINAKYAGYIDRQKDEVQRCAHYENLRLPPDLDYMQVSALSVEARPAAEHPAVLTPWVRPRGCLALHRPPSRLLLVHLRKSGARALLERAAPAADEVGMPANCAHGHHSLILMHPLRRLPLRAGSACAAACAVEPASRPTAGLPRPDSEVDQGVQPHRRCAILRKCSPTICWIAWQPSHPWYVS